MAEITAALSLLLRVVGPLLTEYMRGSVVRRDNIGLQVIYDHTRSFDNLIAIAKDILDRNEVVNSEDLEEASRLTITVTDADIYWDAINYIFQHGLGGYITWNDEIKENCDNLIRELRNQTIGFRSGNGAAHSHCHSHRGPVPLQLPGNLIRRFLLYLSYFPQSYIFNRKRITRLAAVNEFSTIISNSHGERPQWIEAAESCWGAHEVRGVENRIAFHFTVPNNLREQSLRERWPEIYVSRHLVRDLNLANNGASASETMHIESFLFLSCNNHSSQLDLENQKLCLVRVLSLRNINLSNLVVLKKLTFIRYLDLKHTNVKNYNWLESLKDLEVLDLRYTYVEVILDKYLKKLTKLKHLLLGTNFIIKNNKEVKQPIRSLAGVELNVQQLKAEHLETLRAVRWPMELENAKINGVVDLSVTHVKPNDMDNFWAAVENFDNLTILGVAVTKGSKITLQGCPEKLLTNLERLQIDGRFTSSSTSSQRDPLDKLKEFQKLIDLTLVSQEGFSSIPSLPKLICLRLYGSRKNVNSTFEFNKIGFDGLKKLVIGDMNEVKTVKIGKVIIDALATLKLSNLPLCTEVHIVRTDRNQPPLLKLDCNTDEKNFYKVPSRKIIFLKNVLEKSGNFPYRCSPDLEIYDYHMGKQCYVKLKKESREIVR